MLLSRLLSLSMLLCIGTGTLTAQNAKPDRDGAYKFSVWEDTEGCYANTTSDNAADWIQVNDWISKVCIDIGLTGSKKQHKVVLTLSLSSTENERLAAFNNRITTENTMPIEVALSTGERFQFAAASMRDFRKEQFRNSPTVSAIGMHLDLAKGTSNMCDLTKMSDEQRNGYICEMLRAYDIQGIAISDYTIYFTIKTAPTLHKMAEAVAKKTKKKNDYECATDPLGIQFSNFPDTDTDNPDDILLAPAGYPKEQFSSLSSTTFLRHLYSNCLNWFYKVQLQKYQLNSSTSDDEVRIYDDDGLNYSFCSIPIEAMLVCFHNEKPIKWSYWLYTEESQNDVEGMVVLLGDAIAEEAGTNAKNIVDGRNERAERRIDYKGMDVRVLLAPSKSLAWCVKIDVYPPKGSTAPTVTKPAATTVVTKPTATTPANNNIISQPTATTSSTLKGSDMVGKVMGLVANPSVKTKQDDVLNALRVRYPQSSFGVNTAGKFSYITFGNCNMQWRGYTVEPSVGFEKKKLMYYRYIIEFPRNKFTQQQVIELAQQLKEEIKAGMPDINLSDMESKFLSENTLYLTSYMDLQDRKLHVSISVSKKSNELYELFLDVSPT